MSCDFSYSGAIDNKHLRLLRFDGLQDDTLRWTLTEEPFDLSGREKPDFSSMYALSYCWGTEPATETIFVNDAPFMIRPNLLGALVAVVSHTHKRLENNRSNEEQPAFWIDAICIDQRNNEEKGGQLDLMYDIYSNMQVLIWLGPESYLSDSVMHVFEWLEYRRWAEIQRLLHSRLGWRHTIWKNRSKREFKKALSALAQLIASSYNISERNLLAFERLLSSGRDFSNFDFARQGDIQGILPASHPWWKAMIEFYTRPWFSRVWTLQEAWLAQDAKGATVLCGKTSVAWAIVVESRTALLKQIELYTPVTENVVDRWTQLYLIEFSDFYEVCVNTESKADTFRHIMLYANNLVATNPKDYVYGFLGLVSPAIRNSVRKQYDEKVSIAEVFAQAVDICSQRWAGEASQKGDEFWFQLSYKRLHRFQSDMVDLPSWCPDFRLEGTKFSRPGVGVDDPSLGEEDNHFSYDRDTQPACAKVVVKFPELIIRGLQIDSIVSCATFAIDALNDLDTTPQARQDMCIQTLQWIANVQEKLSSESMSEWLPKYFHPGEFFADVFSEQGYTVPAVGEAPATAMAVLQTAVAVAQLDDVNGEEAIFRRIGLPKQQYENRMNYLAGILLRNTGVYFFCTEKGRLGRSLQGCGPGQALCYFPRARYYHVLEPLVSPKQSSRSRNGPQQYKHIGHSIIHGLGGEGIKSIVRQDQTLNEFRII